MSKNDVPRLFDDFGKPIWPNIAGLGLATLIIGGFIFLCAYAICVGSYSNSDESDTTRSIQIMNDYIIFSITNPL